LHLVGGRNGDCCVAIEGISPIGFDQLCYRKDAGGWKITGFSAAE
jgi:hypothetical protein